MKISKWMYQPLARALQTALLSNEEEFARSTGAERLTLATAHDNLAAQHIYKKMGYKKMGYVRDEHFLYFHRECLRCKRG